MRYRLRRHTLGDFLLERPVFHRFSSDEAAIVLWQTVSHDLIALGGVMYYHDRPDVVQVGLLQMIPLPSVLRKLPGRSGQFPLDRLSHRSMLMARSVGLAFGCCCIGRLQSMRGSGNADERKIYHSTWTYINGITGGRYLLAKSDSSQLS